MLQIAAPGGAFFCATVSKFSHAYYVTLHTCIINCLRFCEFNYLCITTAACLFNGASGYLRTSARLRPETHDPQLQSALCTYTCSRTISFLPPFRSADLSAVTIILCIDNCLCLCTLFQLHACSAKLLDICEHHQRGCVLGRLTLNCNRRSEPAHAQERSVFCQRFSQPIAQP